MADEATTTTQTATATAGATTTTAAAAGTATQEQAQGTGTTQVAGQATQTQQTTAAPAAGDWRAAITDPKLKEQAGRFNTLDDVIRGNNELRGKLSSAIVKPGEKATDEEKAAYRKALGVPDAPDGYKFPDLPAGIEMTETIKAERAAWAKRLHEKNIPAADAEDLSRALMEDGLARQKELVAADTKYAADAKAALEKKWGPDFAVNKTFHERAVKALADKAGVDIEVLRHIETKGGTFLMDHPDIMQVFAAAGRDMDEGSLGPVGAEQKVAIDGHLRDVRAGIAKAQANNDSREANRLYQQEQAIIARRDGNRAIVGSQGRAA